VLSAGRRSPLWRLTADQRLAYTLDSDFNGTDKLTCVVGDPYGATPTASVTIAPNPLRDSPAANDGQATTNKNTPIRIDALADGIPDPE
jgi:hypothetical protein